MEGFPSNVFMDVDFINSELKRRQSGFGRSNRMNIEQDEVKYFQVLVTILQLEILYAY